MARLKWEDVRAPELSGQNLAYANQAITGAFDRLGQALMTRQTNRDEQAYAEAMSPLMLLDDEEAIRAGTQQAMASLNPRLRLRIAEQMQGLIGQAQDNAIRRDDLGYRDVLNEFGGRISEVNTSAYGGDLSARDRLVADASGRRGAGRFLAEQAGATQTAFQDGNTFRQTGDRDRRNHEVALYNARTTRGQLTLAQNREARRAREEAAANSAYNAGFQLSGQLRNVPVVELPTYAARHLRDSGLEVTQDSVNNFISGISVGGKANLLTSDQEIIDGGIGEFEGMSSSLSSRLPADKAQSKAMLAQSYPDLAVLDRLEGLGDVTYDEGMKAYLAMDGRPIKDRARNEYSQLIREGVTPAMVKAYVDTYGDSEWGLFSSGDLLESIRSAHRSFNSGGMERLEQVRSELDGPIRGLENALARLNTFARLEAQANDGRVSASTRKLLERAQKEYEDGLRERNAKYEELERNRQRDGRGSTVGGGGR